jgi:hypothetical protein
MAVVSYKFVRRFFLEKGPKFAPTPQTIPVKDIVSEVEVAIVQFLFQN